MEQNVIDRPDPGGKFQAMAAGSTVIEEVSGLIKWYDPVKGYGFIVPDDNGPDVFLGKAVVDQANLGLPAEGCRILAVMQIRDRGRSATAVKRLDPPDPAFVETVRTMKAPSRFSGALLKDITGPRCGVIKFFNEERGFGFVTLGDGTPDIFVHVTILLKSGIRTLPVGQKVDVTWGNGPNGLTATDLAVVEGAA